MKLTDIDPEAPASTRVDALMQVLGSADDAGYIGEPVSQLAHGLQAGAAGLATGDVELGLAGLLHDIGHLADPDAPQMDDLGTLDHEALGRDVLLQLGFSERVARLVGGHVAAKRYLARKARYQGRLSPASAGTLRHQGGPMSDAEAQAFERDPEHKAMLRLRSYDEAAKEPEAQVPGLDHWRPLIEAHLMAQEAARVTGPLTRPLTEGELARWREAHLLVLPGVLDGPALSTLRAWVADLEQRPETPGKWMKYFERGTTERQLCRVEDFVPYHAGLAELLCGEALIGMLSQLMGERAVLFKEKVNFKLPGGSGFTAHQDAPAFNAYGQTYHITVLVTADRYDAESGGLEFSDPVEVGHLLPQRPDGSVAEATEAELPWRALDLPPGSIAFFDSYIPHRSPANRSPHPRRGLYVTYNRRSEGDQRAAYFAEKRATFPPEIERQPGVDYLAQAGRFNVGNPIR